MILFKTSNQPFLHASANLRRLHSQIHRSPPVTMGFGGESEEVIQLYSSPMWIALVMTKWEEDVPFEKNVSEISEILFLSLLASI